MRINKYITLIAITLIMSGSCALGFKDMPTSSVPENNIQNSQESQKTQKSKPSLKLTPSLSTSESGNDQIELTIPGIGRLGTLPKLNFGLELLYGANQENQSDSKEAEDGFTVKGSIRKNF